MVNPDRSELRGNIIAGVLIIAAVVLTVRNPREISSSSTTPVDLKPIPTAVGSARFAPERTFLQNIPTPVPLVTPTPNTRPAARL